MVSINNMVSSILNDYYSNGTSSSTTSTTSSKSTTDSSTKNYTGTLVGQYLATATPETANAKTIFEKLSVDMGGDGKSISKDQLDSFIADAKSGKIAISEEELNAVTTLQKNWTQIADGADSITYASISKAGYKDTLTSMVPDETQTTDYAQLFADSTAEAYSKIVTAALEGSASGSDKASSLSTLLNTLLTGTTDENDDSNANLIATITNLIAQSKSTTTTELEA